MAEHIGAKIRKIRMNKNITQTKLSTETGIPQTTICDIEFGRTVPTKERLRLISDALKEDLNSENLTVDKHRPVEVESISEKQPKETNVDKALQEIVSVFIEKQTKEVIQEILANQEERIKMLLADMEKQVIEQVINENRDNIIKGVADRLVSYK